MTQTGAAVFGITGRSPVKRVTFSGYFTPMEPRCLQAGFVRGALPKNPNQNQKLILCLMDRPNNSRPSYARAARLKNFSYKLKNVKLV
mgnify:FL=1